MASLHLPYESWTPTLVPLVGQGWAQAASLWAFCLRVHRVGPSIGVMGSPPRHRTCSPVIVGAARFLTALPLMKFFLSLLKGCLGGRNCLCKSKQEYLPPAFSQ